MEVCVLDIPGTTLIFFFLPSGSHSQFRLQKGSKTFQQRAGYSLPSLYHKPCDAGQRVRELAALLVTPALSRAHHLGVEGRQNSLPQSIGTWRLL